MTEPLSAARLAEIRERARRMIADHVTYAQLQHAEDYSVLLAEVDRLNAELEHAKAALAGDNEGIRLWMLDCGQVTERHRQRANALTEENERLRAEVATLRACDCFPNPSDHADRCPIFIAAFPESGENW